jgi:hypothetical protein
VITASQFVDALKDMVDPRKDGPRSDVTFAYRGSVYVRLEQFRRWLARHGEDGSQGAAIAALEHYGFFREPFTLRDAKGLLTSRSTYRSMDAALVDQLPEWPGPRMGRPGEPADATDAPEDVPDDPIDDGTPEAGRGRLNARQRFLIERRAVDVVTAFYVAQGWTVDDVGAQRIGWDLTVTRSGHPDRHVEAKGTRGPGAEVELTLNEVEQAREHPGNAALAIVSGIRLDGDVASGGVLGLIDPWEPDHRDAVLAAVRFRHRPAQDQREVF